MSPAMLENLVEGIRRNPQLVVKLLKTIDDDTQRGDHGHATMGVAEEIVIQGGFINWNHFQCENKECFY